MLKPPPSRPSLSPGAINRFAIVASRYNSEFVEPMIARALEEIAAIEPGSVSEVVHAPGSFEIPFLAGKMIETGKPDAVICLGVIFEGESAHADLIASAVSDALCQLSVKTLTPVIHGVLLLKTKEQAQERCLGNEINRGTEAAYAAIEVLRAARSITTR